jgi:RNA polymerase sigma factor (sigma-70 family)
MDSGNQRDELLMAQAALGETAPLEQLVRRHAEPLLTFLRRMVGDRHRSEELFQEVFLAIWSKRKQYEFPRPFKPWLYTIAVNKCRAAFRGRAPMGSGLLLDGDFVPPDPGVGPEGLAMAAETAESVVRAVDRLPEQKRAVVALRIWQGLAYADIAKTLGCTEGTVRSHMHHALASLRAMLAPRFGPAADRDLTQGRKDAT